MTHHNYRINGAHRGGLEHFKEIDRQRDRFAGVRRVEVVDPTEGRAMDLARRFQSLGVSTLGVEESAAASASSDIVVTGIDDAAETASLLRSATSARLYETGLVVSSDVHGALGGSVLAVQTTLTPDAKEAHADAANVFDRVSALVPARETSKNITERVLNSRPAARARTEMHRRFVEQSADFVEGGAIDAEFRVVDGGSGTGFTATTASAPRTARRRDLKRMALHEIAPAIDTADSARAVVFYDSADPWLYIVLTSFSRGRWVPRRAIELPVQPPPIHPFQLTDPRRDAGRAREVGTPQSALRVFVTD